MLVNLTRAVSVEKYRKKWVQERMEELETASID